VESSFLRALPIELQGNNVHFFSAWYSPFGFTGNQRNTQRTVPEFLVTRVGLEPTTFSLS